MTNPTPDPQNPPAPEPQGDDAETAFWNKHKEHTLGILDEYFAKRDKAAADASKTAPPAPGTTRTGHKRVTLSSLFADAVFGPKKDE